MIEQAQFQGCDTVTDYDYYYDRETGVLHIGCQDHTIAEWRERSEQIINRFVNIEPCRERGCSICAKVPAKLKHARAELPKLLDAIEASERVTPDLIQYNTSRPETILPADVYDTLELSALAFGGIGARTYYEGDNVIDFGNRTPRCAVGHATNALASESADTKNQLTEVLIAPWGFEPRDRGLWGDQINDQAIYAINERKGKGECSPDRVTFYEWAGELNVRRGE